MGNTPFGKIFQSTLFFLALAELCSLITYIFKPLHAVAFIVVIVLIARLLLKHPEYTVPVILAELCIGGKGYLFWFNAYGATISIRMAIFILVFTLWILPLIRHPARIKEYGFLLKKPTTIVFGLLILAIALQFWHGINVNQATNTLLDFNAWLFFALVVIFTAHIAMTRYDLTLMYGVVGGAITFLALKTIIALFLFSHGLTGVGGVLYGWIRDTGVGEITHIAGPLFRVFFQSQLYALFGCIIALAFLLFHVPLTGKHRAGLWIFIYLTTLTIIISQSRSFWIGLVAGLISIFIYAYIRDASKKIPVTITAGALLLILVSHFFTINIITANHDGNILANRFNNLPTEPASATRLNQLKPLKQAIISNPVIGYGFGKTLTYTSDDPRVRAQHPDGQFTTYAFEWGYYDLWLKFGAIGLTIYLAYIANIGFSIGREAITKKNVLAIGLCASLISLLTVHNFSPYLNHPLGIGFLLFITAWSLKKDPQEERIQQIASPPPVARNDK